MSLNLINLTFLIGRIKLEDIWFIRNATRLCFCMLWTEGRLQKLFFNNLNFKADCHLLLFDEGKQVVSSMVNFTVMGFMYVYCSCAVVKLFEMLIVTISKTLKFIYSKKTRYQIFLQACDTFWFGDTDNESFSLQFLIELNIFWWVFFVNMESCVLTIRSLWARLELLRPQCKV